MGLNLELLLHPVRMRIVQAFIPRKQLTTQQLLEIIPDVAQATLYRHLAKLVEAKVIGVAEENKIRGTIEKVYELTQSELNDEDIEKISAEEHSELFLSFVTHLLSDFNEYIHKDNINVKADGLSYRQAKVFLTDDEYSEYMKSLNTLMLDIISKKAIPGRKLRTLTHIVIPE